MLFDDNLSLWVGGSWSIIEKDFCLITTKTLGPTEVGNKYLLGGLKITQDNLAVNLQHPSSPQSEGPNQPTHPVGCFINI